MNYAAILPEYGYTSENLNNFQEFVELCNSMCRTYGGDCFEDRECVWRVDSFSIENDENYRSEAFVVMPIGVIEGDGLGGFRTRYYTATFTSGKTLEQVKWLISKVYEIQHCQHVYDCCGHYYSNGGNVIGPEPYTCDENGASTQWVFSISFTQNV